MDNQEVKSVRRKVRDSLTMVNWNDGYTKISEILEMYQFEPLNPTTMTTIMCEIASYVNPTSYIKHEIYDIDVINFDKIVNNIIRENTMLQCHGRAYVLTSPTTPKTPIYQEDGRDVYTIIYIAREEN
jgi:hypothetical protein